MCRRGALALLLLLLALHPLAHEEGIRFAGDECAFEVELHASAECPCIRGGATGVAAPELSERLAVAAGLAEPTRAGYTSVDFSAGIPSRAPPSFG